MKPKSCRNSVPSSSRALFPRIDKQHKPSAPASGNYTTDLCFRCLLCAVRKTYVNINQICISLLHPSDKEPPEELQFFYLLSSKVKTVLLFYNRLEHCSSWEQTLGTDHSFGGFIDSFLLFLSAKFRNR